MRTVSLVDMLFVALRIFIGGAFGSSLDAVFRHVYCFGVLYSGPEAGIAFGVSPAFFHGNGYFLAEACELYGHFSPALEFTLFPEFKCSSHLLYVFFR